MIKDIRKWAKENHFQYSENMNHQKFYRSLSEMNLPIKKVDIKGKVYLTFVPKIVYQTMADLNYLEVDQQSESVTASKPTNTGELDALLDMEF